MEHFVRMWAAPLVRLTNKSVYRSKGFRGRFFQKAKMARNLIIYRHLRGSFNGSFKPLIGRIRNRSVLINIDRLLVIHLFIDH